MPASTPTGPMPERLRVAIRGAVQGVGFRPFVYRLASEMGLPGWVNNTAQGVFIEVDGARDQLERFLVRLEVERPPRAFIQSIEPAWLDAAGFSAFQILSSNGDGAVSALMLPDIAACPDCLAEVFDPANRRYRYPFTNCTNCGPRYSIIQTLPYDRPNTTMRGFGLCPACRAEYEDPLDRRFHAQPTACPVCGPRLALWNGQGLELALEHQALLGAAEAIRYGRIVAIKGLGGFQLMADARNDSALAELRRRKHRHEKPLALMLPSLDAARELCRISSLEARLLASPEAPIVLLRRAPGESRQLAVGIAPGNPSLGVMLPYTPLHHLLMAELGFAVVATSGNLSDEPICTDEREALHRLGGIADLFLVHNRPIARHVDDSVVRIALGRELVLRRARGYAPLPAALPRPVPTALAFGAHQKNSLALALAGQAFISQHIGDLDTAAAADAAQRTAEDLTRLYAVAPEAAVCDAHPDYASTRAALRTGLPVLRVQHHHAHVLACMAENGLDGPVLGVAWDGTGYGSDGTIWGGEFLRVDDDGFARLAHLRSFRLPGGEKAVREPRRAACGLLYELYGEGSFGRHGSLPLADFSAHERSVLAVMLRQGINSPLTSSAGRLFDAVAALAGLRQVASYEGQAAMELEYALAGVQTGAAYDFDLLAPADGPLVVDWGRLVAAILADLAAGQALSTISARFHNTLVEAILAVAQRIGLPRVALSGGCFQNEYLLEQAVARLRQAGFHPYWHQRIPPNDGGIALGQLVALAQQRPRPGQESLNGVHERRQPVCA
jgi:hydrogenase maturation protein HypF